MDMLCIYFGIWTLAINKIKRKHSRSSFFSSSIVLGVHECLCLPRVFCRIAKSR